MYFFFRICWKLYPMNHINECLLKEQCCKKHTTRPPFGSVRYPVKPRVESTNTVKDWDCSKWIADKLEAQARTMFRAYSAAPSALEALLLPTIEFLLSVLKRMEISKEQHSRCELLCSALLHQNRDCSHKIWEGRQINYSKWFDWVQSPWVRGIW